MHTTWPHDGIRKIPNTGLESFQENQNDSVRWKVSFVICDDNVNSLGDGVG